MASEREETIQATQDFECALCHELWHEPCVLSCGHVFCWSCLQRCTEAARPAALRCPLCRRVLPISAASDVAVCEPLARLLKERFPVEYARRHAEENDVREVEAKRCSKAAESCELGIFILDAVLPRQRLHLNVFEPRYCSLVRAALEGGRCFGIVGTCPRSGYQKCGVEVLIEDCVPQLDGRFIVHVLGVRIFRILDAYQNSDGYLMAKVNFVPVDSVECREEDVLVAQQLSPLISEWEDLVRVAWPQHLVAIEHDLGPLPSANQPGDRALWVAALVNPLPPLGIAPEIRPEVLAAEDVQARLSVVKSGLELSLMYLQSTAKSPVRKCLKVLTSVHPLLTMIIVVIAACGVSAAMPAVTHDHTQHMLGAFDSRD